MVWDRQRPQDTRDKTHKGVSEPTQARELPQRNGQRRKTDGVLGVNTVRCTGVSLCSGRKPDGAEGREEFVVFK